MATSSSRTSEPGSGHSAPTPGLIAAALLLPPLAIFLAEGVTRDFWIGFALTCLGYLPGVGYAFFVLLNRRGRGAAT